jgi:hypothetical protein
MQLDLALQNNGLYESLSDNDHKAIVNGLLHYTAGDIEGTAFIEMLSSQTCAQRLTTILGLLEN